VQAKGEDAFGIISRGTKFLTKPFGKILRLYSLRCCHYLRLLNKKNEGFVGPKKSQRQSKSKIPEAVDKPKFVRIKKLVAGKF
jgi:hypothetical protein